VGSWVWSDRNVLFPFLIFLVLFIRLWCRFLGINVGVPAIVVWRRASHVILLVISWIWSFWTFIWPIWSWVLQTTWLRLGLKWSWNWMWILIPVIHSGIHICWVSSIIEISLSQMAWLLKHHIQRLRMLWHHPWVICYRWHLHMHWILKLLLIKRVENRRLL